MITLDTIVGVLLSVMERVGDEFFDDGLEGLGEIGDHFVWFAMSDERRVEECACGPKVASAEDVHVDDLALFIYGSVDVSPGSGDLT